MQTLGLSDQSNDYSTDSVYGISRDVPLNYVTREEVDNKLIDNLTREKHLVIYGSSKQGKTCLRKHCLQESDYITVQCSNKWTVEDLHSNILKRAGFKINISEKKNIAGKNKIIASAGATFMGSGVKTQGELERSFGTENITKELELDPSDVNDIIAALKRIDFNRYIVLEDFHYLTVETQRDFAVALKAFHEGSRFCFLIIGVWLEENRLAVYNGDLTGRVVSVNADRWSDDELIRVIDRGAFLLNIKFTTDFVGTLLKESYGSVSIVQEVCRRACIKSGITHRPTNQAIVGQALDVKELVQYVISEQNARYMSFLNQFSEGFQTTQLAMYKWLLYPLLTATTEKLEEGFTYRDLRDGIRKKHPSGEGLNPGNLTQALQSTASLQVKKNITPIILDYDQTNSRMNIVDRGFIIWMGHQNRIDLLTQCDLPVD